MRIRTTMLGAALLLFGPAAAEAAETAARMVLATVDTSGRVVPAGADPSPCPNAVPMAPEAARDLVARLAAAENVQPEFALSVAKIESRYASTALSAKGAFGLMQLMPETAKRFAVDLCDAEGNVRGGLRLLRFLQDRYRNPLTVLAAYNAGEDAVRRARGVPPFPETVRFVADVMNDLNAWPPARSAGLAASESVDAITAVDSSARTDVAETRPEPSAPAQWSAGFVMHVQ